MTDTGYSEILENLMEQYGDEIKRFCTLQLRDRFQAEDAAQDTFVKAWKALDTFRNESSQKTWLMHIAVNVCRDYQRTGWFRHMNRSLTPEDLPEQITGNRSTGRARFPLARSTAAKKSR